MNKIHKISLSKICALVIIFSFFLNSSVFANDHLIINTINIDVSSVIGKINRPPIKMVALTFDDGPHYKTTPLLLDILIEHDVNATFFVLATNAQRYPDIINRIINEGHTLGSHGNNHELLTRKKQEELTNLMNNTLSLLETITDKRPVFIRPPYGLRNDYFDTHVDATIVLWDVDSNDWKLKNPEKIADNIINDVRHGSIVLLHDIYEFSVEAVPIIIEKLKKEGYTLVSLEQMYQEYDKEIVKKEVIFSGRSLRIKK